MATDNLIIANWVVQMDPVKIREHRGVIMKTYDVIVIGAGPAGIFAGLEMADKGLDVVILDKGRDITARSCPKNKTNKACVYCKPCDVVCGWGGAGAFSDGKLTLTTEFGGALDEYMEKAQVAELIQYIDQVYLKFGAGDRKVYGDDHLDDIRRLQRVAASADLSLIPARIRHLGTDRNIEILTEMRQYLHDKCEVRMNTIVDKIIVNNGVYEGVLLAGGELLKSKYLVGCARQGRLGVVCQAGPKN